MGQPRWSSPGHNRTHNGVCLPDTDRRAALSRILLDGSATLDAASVAIGHGLALTAAEFRVLAFVSLVKLHPCQQAASHLPCTRPPDRLLPNRSRDSLRGLRRGSHYRAAQRAFVTTRSGFDTMARRRQETDDEITEADDTAGAATFGGAPTRGTRQVTPPSVTDDLRTALVMPTTFGPKLFEISTLHAVSAECTVKVKDAGDLLLLRDWLFESSGPPTCGL